MTKKEEVAAVAELSTDRVKKPVWELGIPPKEVGARLREIADQVEAGDAIACSLVDTTRGGKDAWATRSFNLRMFTKKLQ